MKIGVIQYDSNNSFDKNKQTALNFLSRAVKDKCQIVCFPEIFLESGETDFSLKINDANIDVFKTFAKENNIAIILGSITIKNDDGSNSNTCLVIDNQGKVIHRYNKIHMFKTFRDDYFFDESTIVKPGDNLGIFELFGIKMGVAICYDLRFPKLFQELSNSGAKIIFLPSCFRKSTGYNAWQHLPEARAIENQVYFCACSQSGGSGVKVKCGNSRIINYKGDTLASLGNNSGFISYEVNFEEQENYRKLLPLH